MIENDLPTLYVVRHRQSSMVSQRHHHYQIVPLGRDFFLESTVSTTTGHHTRDTQIDCVDVMLLKVLGGDRVALRLSVLGVRWLACRC